jgi:hypothetical protein
MRTTIAPRALAIAAAAMLLIGASGCTRAIIAEHFRTSAATFVTGVIGDVINASLGGE